MSGATVFFLYIYLEITKCSRCGVCVCACVIPVTFQQPYNFMEMRNGFSWVPVFNLDTSQLNEQVGMLSVVNKELQNTMHSSLKAENRNKNKQRVL